jgi:zinc protease
MSKGTNRRAVPARFGVSLAAMLVVSSCASGAPTPDTHAAPMISAQPPAAAAAATPARDPVVAKIAAMKYDIPYTKYVLKNGLTLIVHEDTKTPTVTFHLVYHVGSKNEPKGRSGFAHLFEHLMFNGSQHFNDDFFKATQQIGATNQNGSTNTDRTNYYQTVPKEALDTILWLESDRMGYLLGAVDQKRLDEQRGVVQNEKRQGENQPYGQVNNHTVAATYPDDHPYGHTVIGSMEDLNAAKMADVQDWFKTWYGPANAIMVIAGDIKPEEAKAQVEKYFAEIPPGPPPSQPKSWVPPLAENQREIMYDRVAQPRLYMTWNVPELGNPDGELLDHVAAALGGDKNARLTKRLVFDEQVATSVVVANPQSEIAGQFRIIVTAKPDADLKRIEAEVNEEVNRLLTTGPTQAEIDKNIVQTVSGVISGLESTSSKAAQLAQWEMISGDPNGWKTSLERLEAATPASVQAAARKWLTRGSYTLTVLPFGDPKASGPGVDRSKMPAPGSIADAGFPAFQTATLNNGMKVYLVERHDVPQVNVSMLLDTGYPPDIATIKDGLSGLTANLLDEGTTTRSALQIADELDRLGAGLGAGGGGENSSVEFSALTPTLDQVMAIWADVIRNPAFNEADFKRIQSQTLQGLQAQLRDPNAIAQRVMSKVLWGGEAHPYGHLVTPDEIAGLSRADAAAFHRAWYGPNNATLFVVGDTTLAEITPKLEAALAGWAPAPNKRAPVANGSRATKPSVYLIDRPDSAQSVILVGSTQAPRNPSEDTRISAFNALFGGNFTSRVNMNLREDKGWSYGARSGVSGGRGPRTFIVTAPVQTDATKGALGEIRKELTDVVGRKPPTAAELNTVRTNTLLGMASRWETSDAVIGSLMDIDQFNLPADYWDKYADAYRTVTPGEVEAMAKKLIPDHNQVWVIVGDRAKIEKGIRELNLGELHIVDANGNPAE